MENKMSDLNSLVTTNVVNIKIGEVVNKIPDASGLVKKTYWEETARRLQERVLDHAGKDRKSNMVKCSMDTGHPSVCMKDFQILRKRFNYWKFKRKICEALLLKKHRPTLNTQEHSGTLELFSWNQLHHILSC